MGKTDYKLLTKQLAAFAKEEPRYIPLLANASALLFDALSNVNWAGFYLADNNEPAGGLLLGPFQGKPACIRIPSGKGVCGTAFATGRVIRVGNVHDFPGHIACDSASESEIVLPIRVSASALPGGADAEIAASGGKIVGVLDIDSPIRNRFTEADEAGLAAFVKELAESGDFAGI